MDMLLSILKTDPLFDHFSEEELFLLLRMCEKVKHKQGEVVFEEGDKKGQAVYFIEEGIIKIVKGKSSKQKVLAMFGVGNIFGEMSFLDNKSRSATAVVDDDATLLKLEPERLRTLEKTAPTTAINLLKVFIIKLASRLRHTDDYLVNQHDKIIIV